MCQVLKQLQKLTSLYLLAPSLVVRKLVKDVSTRMITDGIFENRLLEPSPCRGYGSYYLFLI